MRLVELKVRFPGIKIDVLGHGIKASRSRRDVPFVLPGEGIF